MRPTPGIRKDRVLFSVGKACVKVERSARCTQLAARYPVSKFAPAQRPSGKMAAASATGRMPSDECLTRARLGQRGLICSPSHQRMDEGQFITTSPRLCSRWLR